MNVAQSQPGDIGYLHDIRKELYGDNGIRMIADLSERLQNRPYIYKLVVNIRRDLEIILGSLDSFVSEGILPTLEELDSFEKSILPKLQENKISISDDIEYEIAEIRGKISVKTQSSPCDGARKIRTEN